MSREDYLADYPYNQMVNTAENLISCAKPHLNDDKYKGEELLEKAINLRPNNGLAYCKKAMSLTQNPSIDSDEMVPAYVPDVDLQQAFDYYTKSVEFECYREQTYRYFFDIFVGRKKDYAKGEVDNSSLPFSNSQIMHLCDVLRKVIRNDQDFQAHLHTYEAMFDFLSKAVFRYKNEQLMDIIGMLADKLLKNGGTSTLKYRFEQALAKLDFGQTQDSQGIWEDILKRNPNFVNDVIKDIRHEKYAKHRARWSEVIAELSKLRRLDPENAHIHYALGRALEQYFPNEITKTIEYYKKAVSLLVEEDAAWIGSCHSHLARLLSVVSNDNEALAHIIRAQEYELGNAKFRLEKARILKVLGKHTDALSELEIAQKLNAKAMERKDEKESNLSGDITAEKQEIFEAFKISLKLNKTKNGKGIFTKKRLIFNSP